MRRIQEGEVPYDGGTAVQEDAGRPVLLATGMDPEHMGKRVRIRCGRCRTVNVSAEVPVELSRRRAPGRNGGGR